MHFKSDALVRKKPGTPPRIDVALAIVGTLLTGSLVMWAMVSPEYFRQIPMMLAALVVALLALAMVGIGWLGLVQHPPIGMLSGLIVFAYCMSDFSMRKGGVEPGSFDIQSIAKGIVWCVILLFGIVNGAKPVFRDRALSIFCIYALFAFCSAFYSPSIGLGLGSGVALLALGFYSGVISSWEFSRISSTWRNLFLALSLMAFFSVVFYFALPEWARDYKAAGAGRLRGVTGSGNSLGPLVGVATIIGFYCWRTAMSGKAKLLIAFAILVNLAALVLTQSRSSMVALVGAIAITRFLAARAWIWLFFSGIAAIGAWVYQQQSIVDDLLSILASVISRGGNVSEITSVTGRSDIWDAATTIWLKSPWVGFGLGSPRVLLSEAHISSWQTYESAHNWLLESLVSFGVVGTTLLSMFLTVLFVKVFKLYHAAASVPSGQRTDEDWLSFCLMRCLIFALINGMTEKAFAGVPSPTTTLLAITAASAIICQGLISSRSHPISDAKSQRILSTVTGHRIR